MEIIGVTRPNAQGNPEDVFVVRCSQHDWYYKGMPPITTGCPECWNVYYFCQVAQARDIPGAVEQLESAIRHTAELVESGGWDFKPLPFPEVTIEKEN